MLGRESRAAGRRRDGGRGLLERAIAIAEATLPPDHPALATYRANLAFLNPP